jgi:perosamine synthetase
MDPKNLNRRTFITAVTAGSMGAVISSSLPAGADIIKQDHRKLALLGGKPVRDNGPIGPPWPHVDEKMIESVVKTTRSGIWSRIQSPNGTVPTFEKEFAKVIGAAYSVGTGSGTQALSTCVEALGIGAGDEVITSPYTDFGTISAILTSRALPVMADLDPDSYQIDPDQIEKRITKNTRAIMPVHIMGVPANMERIMAIAKKHNLKVIEDSCQAPFARYQGKAIGMIGDLGCFSFQASKAIACGEGGAVVGNDEALMEHCFTVHNRGASRKGSNETIGPKYRMNEFEGAILMAQLDQAKERFVKRNENANYLSSKLKDFPGLVPQKQYPGTEGGAYYHYAMTFHKEHWNGANRSQFLKAINAEGIAFGSYIKTGFHREPWIDHILGLKVYKTMYGPARLKLYKEQLDMPNCDRICNETLVSIWGSGTLLGTREEMDSMVDGIMKVYENREEVRKL